MMTAETVSVVEVEHEENPVAQPRRRRITEARAVFTLSLAVYLVLAWLFVFRYDSVLGDALSRVANAYYMVYSRDPKLAAVGFVWTPLPSLVMAPFLPLKALWPALVSRGFLANIESALFMAGAATLLRGILADLGLSRAPRLTLVMVFVLNPMSLYYGANGMSEALLLFFLLAAVLPLARWMRQPSPRHLVAAGVALGLGYLARYEAVVAGLAVAVLVGVVSFFRARYDSRDRRYVATADAALVGVPVALSFGLWALASWLIVGHPFDTFNSRYGNTAQVSASRQGIQNVVGGTGGAALEYVAHQVFVLAPALILVLVVALVVALRRRDPWIAAAIVPLGGVMAFQAATLAAAGSFGWLRFQITAIPLTAVLVGYLLAPAWGRSSRRAMLAAPPVRRRLLAAGSALTALVVTGAGSATAFAAFGDSTLAREEYTHITPVVHQAWGWGPSRRLTLGDLDGERRIAEYLDRRALGDGTVLVDVALGFPIVLASAHPKRFVITPDRDFPDAVTDPVGAHIGYILISRDTGTMDAISAKYPSLYDTGAGFARLVRQFPSPHGNGRTWRLYRVMDVRSNHLGGVTQ